MWENKNHCPGFIYFKSFFQGIIQASFPITSFFFISPRKNCIYTEAQAWHLLSFEWKCGMVSKTIYLHSWQNLNITGRHIFLWELCRALRDSDAFEFFVRLWELPQELYPGFNTSEGESYCSRPTLRFFSVCINSHYSRVKAENSLSETVYYDQSNWQLLPSKLKYSIYGLLFSRAIDTD